MKRQSSEEEMARAIARLGAADIEEEEEKQVGKRARGKGKRRAGSTKAKERVRWEEEDEEDVGSNGDEEEEEDEVVNDSGVSDDDGGEDEDDAAEAIMQLAHDGDDDLVEDDDDGDDDDGEEEEEKEEEEEEETGGEEPARKKAKKAKKDEGELAREALREKEERLKYRTHEFRLQLEALLARQHLDYDALGAAARVADLQQSLAHATCPGRPAWRAPTQLALTGAFLHRTAVVPTTGAPALVADVAATVPASCLARGGTLAAWAPGLAAALRYQMRQSQQQQQEEQKQQKQQKKQKKQEKQAQAGSLSWIASLRIERYFGGVQTVLLELAQPSETSDNNAPTLTALRIVPVERASSADAFVAATMKRCRALRDTAKLVKLWLGQRGMRDVRQPDALGGFGATLLLAHVAAATRTAPEMTTYQLFRHFLTQLAAAPPTAQTLTQQLTAPPPSLLAHNGGDGSGGAITGEAPVPVLVPALATAPAVLVSPDGRTNCAAHMTPSALAQLTFFARVSLSQLDADNTIQSGFPELFETPVRPELLYDVLVSFPLDAVPASEREEVQVEKEGKKKSSSNNGGDDNEGNSNNTAEVAIAAVGEKVTSLLTEALGDRCFLVRPVATAATAAAGAVVVGLVLNPETAFLQVQKGAPADDAERSRRFRALWGSRAEVRSFQDTSVCNCVVFAVPAAERHTVVPAMVAHLLEHNLGLARARVHVSGAALDAALPGAADGRAEQEMALLARDFDVLARRLCAMDLPLRIREVLPTSPALRYTAVSVPQQVIRGVAIPTGSGSVSGNVKGENGKGDKNGKNGKQGEQECEEEQEQVYIPALKGVIHFESSSAWPEDLEAFRSVKTALLVAVAEVLRQKYLIDAFAYPDRLDVVFKGSVFSLAVHHPREGAILRRAGRHAEAAALARDLLYRPMHHALVGSLCAQHYAYSRAARLAKRWLAAHMFSGHVADEAVELLVARCFAQPSPLLPPQTPTAALARVLALLGALGAAAPGTPLVVDTGADLAPAEYRRLQAHRAAPGTRAFAPLRILTPNVGGRSLWTAPQQPGPVVLKRIAAVATASLALLARLVTAPGQADSAWRVLFNPPLEPYSFTVHLRLERLTRLADSLDWHLPLWAHRLVQQQRDRIALHARSLARIGAPLAAPPVLEFDPAAAFCRELAAFLGPSALVFHDELGGSVVGVVWNPTAFTPRRWGAQNPAAFAENRMPIADVASREARQFALNVPQILADVRVLGNGIVYELRKQGQAPAVQEGPCSDK